MSSSAKMRIRQSARCAVHGWSFRGWSFRGCSFRGCSVGILVLMLAGTLGAADDAKLSEAQRMAIIHTLLAERPFVHRAFPRGKAGVRIEGDKITPSDAEMNQVIAQYGEAAKPGERVQITDVRFEHHGIVFEINGGPVKRKKLRDRISIGVNGMDPRGGANDSENVYTNSTGSSVFLAIKENAASLNADRVKEMLSPILDFKAQSVAEAYERSLSPLLLQAVKNHRALVGMDKDMVLYAKGRPPRRLRESREGKDYEEWIYGDPPQDVEFIRFLEDKVVSIEQMKVSGEKVVRTQDEVGDLGGTLDASAKKQRPEAMAGDSAAEQPSAPPTLLRPGEKQTGAEEGPRDANPKLPPDVPPPGPGPGGPN